MNDQDDADFEDSGSFAAGSVRFLSPEVGLPSVLPSFSPKSSDFSATSEESHGIGVLRRVRAGAGA